MSAADVVLIGVAVVVAHTQPGRNLMLLSFLVALPVAITAGFTAATKCALALVLS